MIALGQVSNTPSSTQIVTSSDATTAPSAEPSESPTPTPTVTESAAEVAASPTATAYALPSCPADIKNHGAYVSGVAHSAPKGKDGEHGSWVSQAAQSSCGKSSDSADSPEPDETESPESDSPKPQSPKTQSPKPEHSQAVQSPRPTKTADSNGMGGHGHH